MTLVLRRANKDLVCWCDCEPLNALVAYPGQADCPWCGCGWLFSCITCRKAFTFAEVVEVETSLEELAKKDLEAFADEEPEPSDVREWVEAMAEWLEYAKVGDRFVYLDGCIVPADHQGELQLEGMFAKHTLPGVPQIAALTDPKALDKVLGNTGYWQKNRFDRDE